MSDIDDLQRRLSAALDRIGQGVADMAAAPKDAGQDVDAIRKSLDDAMAAKDRLETRMAELDAELAEYRQGDGFVFYDTVTEPQRQELSTKIDALSAEVSQVQGVVAGQ